MIAPPDTQAPTAPGTPGPRRVMARFDRQPDDLLAEFAIHGRQDCFEEIVRRYGAMVLNVCVQVTRHRQDAEDATQVVFLVLAERLRAGEKIISPGRWLQQVARRAALDIRRSRCRRRRRERQQAKEELIHPPEGNDDSAARLVREELDRVPAKYRIPLVLHYFNGQSFPDAAKELGIKPSTLGVRLFRGRKLLAERLARRGVTLSTVALAALLAAVIRKSISDALVKSVAHLSLKGGTSAGAGPVAMGSKGLAALAGSYTLKIVLTAGLLAAAAVGARAAVQWHSDAPLLDFHNLLPSFPDLRAHLPHFRADAGDAARKAGDHSNNSNSKPSPNPYENWVVVPRSHSTTTDVQPAIPNAPVEIAKPGTPSQQQLSPQLFQAPPAVARHDPSAPAILPPLQDRKIIPNLSVPPIAPGHLASSSANAPSPTPTPDQSGGKLTGPSIFPHNAAGLGPNGPQNAAPLNGGDDSSGNPDDNSHVQSSLFGPNSLQGPLSSDGMLGQNLSDNNSSANLTLAGSTQAADLPDASVVTPEPAGLAIVITAASGLLLRRRRKLL